MEIYSRVHAYGSEASEGMVQISFSQLGGLGENHSHPLDSWKKFPCPSQVVH